jgi:hypothetical protein
MSERREGVAEGGGVVVWCGGGVLFFMGLCWGGFGLSSERSRVAIFNTKVEMKEGSNAAGKSKL